MALTPFQDSIYAQPGLVQQTRQFDRNPNRGESLFAAIASPSAAALASEASSLVRAKAKGVPVPSTVSALMTANRDTYRNAQDSASYKH